MGGGRPDTSLGLDGEGLGAWVCLNTEISAYQFLPGAKYEDLHQHLVSEMGLGPRADLRVHVWSEAPTADGEVGHEVVQIRGNTAELPAHATCFDVEHDGSKKQKNSDRL